MFPYQLLGLVAGGLERKFVRRGAIQLLAEARFPRPAMFLGAHPREDLAAQSESSFCVESGPINPVHNLVLRRVVIHTNIQLAGLASESSLAVDGEGKKRRPVVGHQVGLS